MRSSGFATVGLAALLAGCALTPEPEKQNPGLAALEQVAGRMPGRYVSVVESGRTAAQNLTIERRSGAEGDALALKMTQGGPENNGARHYGLKVSPSSASIDTRFDGEFALLDPAGEVRRSCSMQFGLGADGLVGKTEPGNCRFGSGNESVGLLKEIAFDGRRISIGDRLVDPTTGRSTGVDRVITFLPATTFSGWVGVKEGDQWRIAREFELEPGRGAIEPLDAADMNLGVAIALNYYRMDRAEGAVLLRLTATDQSNGELLAEAWASPNARSIGFALPDGFQVGLNRL